MVVVVNIVLFLGHFGTHTSMLMPEIINTLPLIGGRYTHNIGLFSKQKRKMGEEKEEWNLACV